MSVVISIKGSLVEHSLFHKAIQFFPFHWNHRKGNLELSSNLPRAKTFLKLSSGFCLFLGIMVLIDSVTNTKYSNIAVKLQASFTATMLLCYAMIYWRVYKSHTLIQTTLDGMITIEKYLVHEGFQLPNEPKIKAAGLLGELFIISGKVLPTLLGLAAALEPEFPTNAFQFLGSNSVLDGSFTGRVMSGLGNFIVWYLICCAAVFIWMETLLNLLYLRVGLLCCIAQVKAGQSTVSKAYQWRVYCLYQKLQLLAHFFNKFHAGALVNLLGMLSHAQMISAYIIIQSFGSDAISYATLCSYLLMNIDSLGVIVGVLGYAGDTVKISGEFLKNVTSDSKFMQDRLGRRIAKTMASIKIQFGGSNYIAKTTPLVFSNFNLQRVVDLLLIEGKQ